VCSSDLKSLLAFAFALLLLPVAALADSSTDATNAAKAWLALVDAGSYAQSWSTSSSLMQARVSQADWAKAAQPIHEQLGAVVSREPAGVDMTKALPGAPDGDYAIVHFKTKFANKADAKETVTMMMDGAAWKCAGYFIN
jgi:hypothetical protein